jgi:hypothetical protein
MARRHGYAVGRHGLTSLCSARWKCTACSTGTSTSSRPCSINVGMHSVGLGSGAPLPSTRYSHGTT